eukprot:m.4955 g.4955  ORF g.4955 m.4955 type:complete len:186 (+) comp2316_c0_seq1:55-612(+)
MFGLVARRVAGASSLVRSIPVLASGTLRSFASQSTSTKKSISTTDGSSQWVGLTMDQDYLKKNTTLNRPTSPHITVYAFPFAANLSVLHRATGIALSAYICTAGIALALNPLDVYINAIQSLHLAAPIIAFGKFALAFPLSYHTGNGIRHLIWDTAHQVTKEQVNSSGIFTIGTGVALALLAAFL